MSGSALGPLRYKGRIFKPSGGSSVSAQQANTIRRNRERAIQLAQFRALDRFALRGTMRTEGAYRRSIPYGGDVKYADMGIGASGTASTNCASGGTIFTFYNISSAFGPGGGGTAAATLCGIVQGTGKNNRIGNKIRILRIRLNLTIFMSNAATTGDIVRLILYKDKQANGAAATITNILELPGTEGWESFQAMDYVDRINIIKERRFDVNPPAAFASAIFPPVFNKKMTIKPNCEIHYSSTTGALTEVQSDNFGLAGISFNSACTVAGTARVYFMDK